MEGDADILTFEVNSDNCVAAVSENWDAFALANEGEGACACRVLGRPWPDFVVGEEMRMLYAGLIDRVRKTKLHVTVPFRCDGPAVRRFMTMTIVSKPNDTVLFRCELLREEPREAAIVLARGAPRGIARLTLCGWCGKAEVGTLWRDLEAAIRVLRLFEADEMPVLSHGICPPCTTRFLHLADET